MLDQVHGTDVVAFAGDPPWQRTVGVGDVLVVDDPVRPVAVWAADCAPVILADRRGRRLVAIHAGWRGLAAGVLDVAVGALGGRAGAAVLGPCIHPCCYEFGADDAARVAAGVGVAPAAVTSTTTAGTAALDLPAAVAVGLARHDVGLDAVGPCTACSARWYSHRARRDDGRHALTAWFE